MWGGLAMVYYGVLTYANLIGGLLTGFYDPNQRVRASFWVLV